MGLTDKPELLLELKTMAIRRRSSRRRSRVFRPEYRLLSAGAIDFVESAVGLGDELDAVVQVEFLATQTVGLRQ